MNVMLFNVYFVFIGLGFSSTVKQCNFNVLFYFFSIFIFYLRPVTFQGSNNVKKHKVDCENRKGA